MCYTRKDRSFEREVRTLRSEEEARRRREEESRRNAERTEKPLTEKAREMVGAR